MDVEQKLEGPWTVPLAIALCLAIVLVMIAANQVNRELVPPPAPPPDIAATQADTPPPDQGAQPGIPSGTSPESAGFGTRGSAGTAVHTGTANVGPGTLRAPSTGAPNPAAGGGELPPGAK
jgi:hypothetical protein